MTGARWKDETTLVTAKDQRLFTTHSWFDLFKQVLESLYGGANGKKRGERPEPNKNPVLADILADDGEDKGDDDVVDRMTGQGHDLDQSRGARRTSLGSSCSRSVADEDDEKRLKRRRPRKR